MSSNPPRERSASSRSGPCFSRPTAMTTRRMQILFPAHRRVRSTKYMRRRRFASACDLTDRLRCGRILRPQPFQVVEFANLRPEYVHDHVAGIDQHPVAIGHALDMEGLDSGFLQRLRDVLRDRTD